MSIIHPAHALPRLPSSALYGRILFWRDGKHAALYSTVSIWTAIHDRNCGPSSWGRGRENARPHPSRAATMLRRGSGSGGGGGGGLQRRRRHAASAAHRSGGARARLLLPRFTFRNFSLFVLALVALAFAPSLYQRFFQEAESDCDWLKKPPLVCAHGGDSSKAPPNTRAAYQLAIDAGVDCIEIDASRTRDGVLVALHDRDLQTMSEHSDSRVGDFTANEISTLDITGNFPQRFAEQHVPTLVDAIEFVQGSVKQVIVDAKVGPPLFEKRLPADLISAMKQTGCKTCVIWAKDDKIVAEIIRRSAKTKTGYIVSNNTLTGKVSELVRFKGTEVVGIYYGLISTKLVKHLRRAGKRAHAWTVNTADGMIEMLKAGVDAIITNNPKLLQLVMEQQKQLCILNGFKAL